MSDDQQVLAFYQAHRFDDQKRFYESRAAEFGAAYRQSLYLTASLSLLTSVAAGLAAAEVGGLGVVWQVLAVVLPLISTALAAYGAVYAFDRQAKLYGDAVNALIRAAADAPDLATISDAGERQQAVARYVARVERIFVRENNQWGQLVSQVSRDLASGESDDASS